MIKLPEPCLGEFYDADQLKQAIRDALEEAAKVFDGEGEEAYSYHAAERIRKLKEDIQ